MYVGMYVSINLMIPLVELALKGLACVCVWGVVKLRISWLSCCVDKVLCCGFSVGSHVFRNLPIKEHALGYITAPFL